MEHEVRADETVSMAVVRAVSAIEGRDPLSLDPLADAVDTDALDALFAPQHDGTKREGGRLSFVYNDCRVTVDDGERLTVQRLAPDATSGDGPMQ